MRIPISASFILLAVAGALAHLPSTQEPSGRVRKSLGFGPELPHAVFNTAPPQLSQGFMPGSEAKEPLALASSFVRELLRNDSQLNEFSSFELRDDSYTDDRTGVTHAYFRQLINGLVVSDGHINANIKDGVVLSYGDSVSDFLFNISYLCTDASFLSFTEVLLPRNIKVLQTFLNWQHHGRATAIPLVRLSVQFTATPLFLWEA